MTSNRADRVLRCIGLFWLLDRTRTRTQSDRTVLVLGSYLSIVPLRPGLRTCPRWNFGMQGESKAEEGKSVAASQLGVSDNRDAAIDVELSSTSTSLSSVRLRVLSTSTTAGSRNLKY